MSTVAERSAAGKRAKREQQVLDWADDRLGSSKWLRTALDRIFPDHWAFMVGEIAMYCFLLLLVTGIYLRCSIRRPVQSWCTTGPISLWTASP